MSTRTVSRVFAISCVLAANLLATSAMATHPVQPVRPKARPSRFERAHQAEQLRRQATHDPRWREWKSGWKYVPVVGLFKAWGDIRRSRRQGRPVAISRFMGLRHNVSGSTAAMAVYHLGLPLTALNVLLRAAVQ